MTFKNLQKEIKRLYNPIFALEDVLPEQHRKLLSKIIFIIFIIALIVSAIVYATNNISAIAEIAPSFILNTAEYAKQIYGLFLIFFALNIISFILKAFHNSYYFRAIDRVGVKASVEVGLIIRNTKNSDITRGFLLSPYGLMLMLRSGIRRSDIDGFLKERAIKLSGNEFNILPDNMADNTIGLSKYAENILENDKEFNKFLFSNGVLESDLINSADWIERQSRELKKEERWWSKNNLGMIPSIGKDWSYGEMFFIKQYGYDMADSPFYASISSASNSISEKEEVDKLHRIISRNRQSNAFLVGKEGSGKLEIIARLAYKIKKGKVMPALENKHIIIFNGVSLIATTKEKGKFEEAFIKILNQARKAGNVILVFEDFPSFMSSSVSIGSDAVNILMPYLNSKNLQFIATSAPAQFHKTIETNNRLMQYFETVFVKDIKGSALMRLLERKAEEFESQAKGSALLTYPAIKRIADGANSYFTSGVMPDKAIDLLAEALSYARQNKINLILKKDINALIESKTGIKLGEIDEQEQEKLLKLEESLHRFVIGQDKAISAISDAMRRSRIGIRNPNKPIGTFLFLGPTGVGKTHTAKALSKVFFSGEDSIIRLDMSEYRTVDALDRLIGSFSSGKQGILSSKLKEKPYGMLLLDEFEKTDSEVLDLFLQILDEGKFSDAKGNVVNARNNIIIATSNAASDSIWEYFKQGRDVSEHSSEFIDEIIKRGIFKPELLNRFDGVIVFHPLNEEHIRKIAKLMLNGLSKRLKDKGVNLIINDIVINKVVEKGYNPKFGARPMNRAIQEIVEQTIADKMIRGEIKRGDTVELTESDLTNS